VGTGRIANDLSFAPLSYIWSEGIAAGVPFGPMPSFAFSGNRTPHDLKCDWPLQNIPEATKITMKSVPLLLVGLMAFVTGCVSVLDASFNYNLVVKNTGKEVIWCSLVASSRGIAHEPGRLVAKASASFAGPFKYPYADKWKVEWKTLKQEKFSKDIDLTDKIQKRFAGRLVFIIDAENNLSFLTEPF